MTREEAIEYLKHADTTVGKKIKTRTAEALEMAIKALEQVPKLQNRCFALTHGKICMFCPYDCENRTAEHRSEENGNDD